MENKLDLSELMAQARAREEIEHRAQGALTGGLVGGGAGALIAYPLNIGLDATTASMVEVDSPLKKILRGKAPKNVAVRSLSGIPPFAIDAEGRASVKAIFDKFPFLRRVEEAAVGKESVREILKGDLKKNLVIINPSSSEQILAHELGHTQRPKNIVLKMLREPALRAMAAAGTPIALGGAAIGGLMYNFSKKERGRDEGRNIAQVGGILGAGAVAPKLVEEMRANVVGLKKLRALGKPWKQIFKESGPLLRAQASYPLRYLTVPVGVLLGSLLMKPKLDAERRRDGHELPIRPEK